MRFESEWYFFLVEALRRSRKVDTVSFFLFLAPFQRVWCSLLGNSGRTLRREPALTQFETAQIANLCPVDAEEAKSIVPRYVLSCYYLGQSFAHYSSQFSED